MKIPCLRSLRHRIEKKISTWLSHDACFGVNWKLPARMCLQAPVYVLGTAGGEVVGDRDDLLALEDRDLLLERIRSKRLRVFEGIASTSPSWTFKQANRHCVPLRLYSCSRRAGLPGAAGRSGLVGALGLDPGLLVNRDDQHVLRRVNVQAADLAHALLEVLPGEVAHDPVVGQVWLDRRPRENHVRLRARHSDR